MSAAAELDRVMPWVREPWRGRCETLNGSARLPCGGISTSTAMLPPRTRHFPASRDEEPPGFYGTRDPRLRP